jgi:hypothetical protein
MNRRRMPPVGAAARFMVLAALCWGGAGQARAAGPSSAPTPFKAPAAWDLSAPLIAPVERPEDPYVSVKDPSIVLHEGLWHVFMTIRPKGHTPTEYVSFARWEDANKAPRHVLALREKYFCAPQVFYFRPHRKWYLVYQVGEPKRRLQHQPAWSTTEAIADPPSWTKAQLFFPEEDPPSRKEAGLDYWVICDEQKAYLFYTSLNGKLWRMWTWLKDFPKGFDHCELALEADIFEASHTYRLKGLEQYLTIVEAGQSGRRYYKAYLADRLDGPWKPLADTEARPFAGAANVRPAPGVSLWADNISHGELVRDGIDETMTIDPNNLRFVIQGVLQKDKPPQYGLITWRIGMLTPAKE